MLAQSVAPNPDEANSACEVYLQARCLRVLENALKTSGGVNQSMHVSLLRHMN